MNSDLLSSSWRTFTGSAQPKPIARWNPARCVWETGSPNLFCGHLELYRETLPPSGMQASGILYELPTSVPRTGESEFSSWQPQPEDLTPERAWMTGLFEGEGWITVCRTPRKDGRIYPRVLIGLAMTDEDAVRRFASFAGAGTVKKYPPGNRGTKPFWKWQITARDDVERILNEMWGGLCSRRRAKAVEAMTEVMEYRASKELLPTPTAQLNAPAPWKPGVDWWLQSRATRNLEGVVTGNTPLLPTPVARDYMGIPGDNVQMASLPREISLLPTPSAGAFNDGEDLGSWRQRQEKNLAKGINGNGQGLPLAIAAQDEVNWGRYSGAIFFWENVLARKAPLPTEPTGRNGNPRLSPKFVEFMMGLPEGWVTDVPDLKRKGQLHSLGNGVVPQQAEMALRLLLARIPQNASLRENGKSAKYEK